MKTTLLSTIFFVASALALPTLQARSSPSMSINIGGPEPTLNIYSGDHRVASLTTLKAKSGFDVLTAAPTEAASHTRCRHSHHVSSSTIPDAQVQIPATVSPEAQSQPTQLPTVGIDNVTSDFAGGFMMNAPDYPQNGFVALDTQFTVPSITAAFNNAEGLLIWAGLGIDENMQFTGADSSLLRAGVSYSGANNSWTAFYNWGPTSDKVNLDSSTFPVMAGDQILTSVFVNETSRRASINMTNSRTGQNVYRDLSSSTTGFAPTLLSCADFMVSQPVARSQVPAFGMITFDILGVGSLADTGPLSDLLDDGETYNLRADGSAESSTQTTTAGSSTGVESPSVVISYIRA